MLAAEQAPFRAWAATGSQYLTAAEFDALVALGEHCAARVDAWRAPSR